MADQEIWGLAREAHQAAITEGVLPADIDLVDYAVSSTGRLIYLILSNGGWMGVAPPEALDEHLQLLHGRLQ